MKKLIVVLVLMFIPMQLAAWPASTEELVSLVALPLAVAAVSEVAGVPQNELADLVATLNNANVPVVQQIQVIRYVPVALVADNGVPFVDFVQAQVTQGVTGPALVPVVVERLQTFYPAEQRIVVTEAPAQPMLFEPVIVQPPVIVTDADARRSGHPHGGPPGQVKKQLGLQTGAEVVHGQKRGRKQVVVQQPMISSSPVVVQEKPKHDGGHAVGHGKKEGHGGDKGDKGKGHGKGKGH